MAARYALCNDGREISFLRRLLFLRVLSIENSCVMCANFFPPPRAKSSLHHIRVWRFSQRHFLFLLRAHAQVPNSFSSTCCCVRARYGAIINHKVSLSLCDARTFIYLKESRNFVFYLFKNKWPAWKVKKKIVVGVCVPTHLHFLIFENLFLLYRHLSRKLIFFFTVCNKELAASLEVRASFFFFPLRSSFWPPCIKKLLS